MIIFPIIQEKTYGNSNPYTLEQKPHYRSKTPLQILRIRRIWIRLEIEGRTRDVALFDLGLAPSHNNQH